MGARRQNSVLLPVRRGEDAGRQMRAARTCRRMAPPLIRYFVTPSPRKTGRRRRHHFLFFASQSCCSLVRKAAHWSATSLAVFWPSSTSWKFLIATWSTKLPRFSRCVGGVTISYLEVSLSSVNQPLNCSVLKWASWSAPLWIGTTPTSLAHSRLSLGDRSVDISFQASSWCCELANIAQPA